MVGESHQSNDPVFIWLVFAHHDGSRRVLERRKIENSRSDLVSQRGGDVYGCDWLCEAAIMGVAEFSNIAK